MRRVRRWRLGGDVAPWLLLLLLLGACGWRDCWFALLDGVPVSIRIRVSGFGLRIGRFKKVEVASYFRQRRMVWVGSIAAQQLML